jgi:hypothetical protein
LMRSGGTNGFRQTNLRATELGERETHDAAPLPQQNIVYISI